MRVDVGAGGILGPDERKFEKDTANINMKIRDLENKLVSCTQV